MPCCHFVVEEIHGCARARSADRAEAQGGRPVHHLTKLSRRNFQDETFATFTCVDCPYERTEKKSSHQNTCVFHTLTACIAFFIARRPA